LERSVDVAPSSFPASLRVHPAILLEQNAGPVVERAR